MCIRDRAADFDSVTITGEDVDLLVFLTALGSSQKNVYFQKSGRGNAPSVLYSSASCKYNTQDILFLHAARDVYKRQPLDRPDQKGRNLTSTISAFYVRM